jgi:hypothetical protein
MFKIRRREKIFRHFIFGFIALAADRVARWFVFKPKIPIWENFGGPWIGKCLHISWPFGIFYGHWGYFMTT